MRKQSNIAAFLETEPGAMGAVNACVRSFWPMSRRAQIGGDQLIGNPIIAASTK